MSTIESGPWDFVAQLKDEPVKRQIKCYCANCTKPILEEGIENFYCSPEWKKLFLAEWDKAVELWDKGRLFQPKFNSGLAGMYSEKQLEDHKAYAHICTRWFLPNQFVEPHVAAEGLDDSNCTKAEVKYV